MASSTALKTLCKECEPKSVVAITSCFGCSHGFCSKHFVEHRNKLQKEFENVVNQHDKVLQELQTKIEYMSNQTDNNDIQNLFKKIDEWQRRTIDACCRQADEMRGAVVRTFNQKKENEAFKKRIDVISNQLKEQQELENFIETDLERWKKQLDDLKYDIIKPMMQSKEVIIETHPIYWRESIKISTSTSHNDSNTYHICIFGESKAGKSTFIDYLANFFANKRTFDNRLSKLTENISELEPNTEATKFTKYHFTVNNRINFVFIDTPGIDIDDDDDSQFRCLTESNETDHFLAAFHLVDCSDADWEDVSTNIVTCGTDLYSEFKDRFKHVIIILTNCKPNAVDFNPSTLDMPEYLSIYCMDNSAYSFDETLVSKDLVADDFHASMMTVEQIVNEMIDWIDQ